MKRLCIPLFLMLAWSIATAEVASKCKRPMRPSIPDGEATTEEKLIEARSVLEQYLKDGDRFLVCLREFEDSLGDRITEVDGHTLVDKYKGMVEEMYLAGDEFNIALRRFKLKAGIDSDEGE